MKRFAITLAVTIVLVFLGCLPAPAGSFACKIFNGLDRNCTSVRLIAKAYGQARAESLARSCGATDDDISIARSCLGKPPLEPYWKCNGPPASRAAACKGDYPE